MRRQWRRSCAHEDQRALRERGVHQQRDAGDGEAGAHVVEQKEGSERPEYVCHEEEWPGVQVFLSQPRSMEQDSRDEEGAGCNQDGCADDEGEEDGLRMEQGREQVLDFGEVGEGADVEADVHELQQDEEISDHGVGGLWKVGGCGEEAAERRGDGFSCGWRRVGELGVGHQGDADCGGDATRGTDGGGGIDAFDGSDEAVAAAGEGFDEAGVGGGVLQGFADAVDGGVEAVVEVDEGVSRPELGGDFFAGEEAAGAFEQKQQELEGLGAEFDAEALAAQLAGDGVGLVRAEAEAPCWVRGGHGCCQCS
jgi:hypothetical protein